MSVYFIQVAPDGPIKIGTALRPLSRLGELQVGNPFDLVVLAVIDGGTALERELHARFAEHRLRGEWFAPSPALIELILASQPMRKPGVARPAPEPAPPAKPQVSGEAKPTRPQICAEDDTEVCPTCHGAGAPDWDNWTEPCPECDGAGEVHPGHVRRWRTAVVDFDRTVLEVRE